MQVNRALIIDVETNGLEDTADVIEIGMVLYSVAHQCALQEFSSLLPCETNEAENVNRIKVAALLDTISGYCGRLALDVMVQMSRHADVYVAHNAEFDAKHVRGLGLDLAVLPWLCTMSDFKWPLATREQGSLINLALDHGIGVSSAHRALTDCRLIASLFDRMSDLQGMFQVAMRPKALFQALVPFERKEEAKQAGFKWNPTDRTWTRSMAIDDAKLLPFRTKQIEQAGECLWTRT